VADLIFTPIPANPTTDWTEIAGSAVPTNQERNVDVRMTNFGAADVMVRLAIGPSGTINPTHWRIYDYTIPGRESRDLEEELKLPSGWALFHRASAATVVTSVSGRKRATN
jgi:hypothetical protein